MTGTSTEFNNYRPPGLRNIKDRSEFQGNMLNFIKRTTVEFLQIVFSKKKSGTLRYMDDEELTEIKIADQYAYQLEATDTRPAIIATRGPVSWGASGINSMQTMDLRTNTSTNTDFLVGSVSLSCISRVGIEAENIAADVFSLIKYFKPTLMKFGFLNVRSVSVGPEQLISAPGEPDLFLVTVLMQCQVQKNWILEPKAAAELKKVIAEGLANDSGN